MEGEVVVSGSQGHERLSASWDLQTGNFACQVFVVVFFSEEICWLLSIMPLSWTAYLFFILVPVAAAHLHCITMPAPVPLMQKERMILCVYKLADDYTR